MQAYMHVLMSGIDCCMCTHGSLPALLCQPDAKVNGLPNGIGHSIAQGGGASTGQHHSFALPVQSYHVWQLSQHHIVCIQME